MMCMYKKLIDVHCLGYDRLMALLCQANSLKDVIAFPKSFNGRDLLTGAPSKIDANELAKYHITGMHTEDNN